MIDFATAMQRAREDRGLTREELAKRAGVAQNSIRGYEMGNNSPSLKALVALSDALNMSIDDYVGHRRKSMFEE